MATAAKNLYIELSNKEDLADRSLMHSGYVSKTSGLRENR